MPVTFFHLSDLRPINRQLGFDPFGFVPGDLVVSTSLAFRRFSGVGLVIRNSSHYIVQVLVPEVDDEIR